jgi:hypothetical protein
MGNDVRVALDPSQTRLFGVSTGENAAAASEWSAHCLRGSVTLGAMRPMLTELSRRTGQTAAMDRLENLLGEPTMQGKTPYLVLVGVRSGVDAEKATADDVQGAVVLHEYQVAGRGARVFSTHDITGQRGVFAPEELRALVAEIAARTLVGQGASMALISVEVMPEAGCHPMLPATQGPRCRVAARRRTMPRDLPVEPTVEATLANLGRRTRRNLRYYRRRVEADLGAAFVPRVEIAREEFLAMNRSSTNPGSDADAAWRYECLGSLPDSMFAGVRAADGRWLSMVGGRRHEGVTEIEWQMNRAGLPRYSLSTVMRSYLLEHEVELGTTKLMFQGGTPHSMRHSLAGSEVLDILAVRRSALAWLLQRLARWVFPRTNFLGQVLQDKSLLWMR